MGFTSANPIVALLGYLDFLHLMSEARVVFTDSGGIQEETTILGVSSITLRESTERLIAVEHGINILVASGPERILGEFTRASRDARKLAGSSHYWDGNAANRIIKYWLMTFPRSDQWLQVNEARTLEKRAHRRETSSTRLSVTVRSNLLDQVVKAHKTFRIQIILVIPGYVFRFFLNPKYPNV